jgi:thiol-disulfide isomerase/thioredoxin
MMTRYFTFMVVLMISCTLLIACGNDDDDGSQIADTPASVPGGEQNIAPDAGVDDSPQDLPPVAPKDFGPAAPFKLSDLDGKQVALDDFKGQVVAVNFWATWCGPCKREVPDFVEVQEKYKDHGFIILGISEDVSFQNGKAVKNEAVVEAFVKQFNVNYPILWDTENVWVELYKGFGMPTTIMVDRNQRIRFRHNGIVDKVTFEAEVEMLVNE